MPKTVAVRTIEILDGDDWIVVKVNGEKWDKLCSNHRIGSSDVVALLNDLGHKATIKYGEFVDGDEDDFVEQ